MQETSATEVCVSTFSFFLPEKGSAPRTCCWRRRWAPGTCTYDDLSTTPHPLQHWSLELDRQETGATEVCESLFSFCKLVPVWPFLHFTLSSWLTVWWIGKGAPSWEGRAQIYLIDGKGALTWKGGAQVCLIDGKGRAQACLIDGKGRAHLRGVHSRKVALFTVENLCTDSAYSIQMV